ncbi:MAG: hydrogenase maturation protease [Methylomonas sp.]
MSARHIICFGNELHGDDGFGMCVYSRLMAMTWPKDVEVFYAGVAGLNALRFLEDCSQAILVDALANFGKVGEVCVLKPDDLTAGQQNLTGHGLGIPYLLEALKIMRNPLPDILIIGVQIDAINPFSIGLSCETEQAVPMTVRLIRGLLPA